MWEEYFDEMMSCENESGDEYGGGKATWRRSAQDGHRSVTKVMTTTNKARMENWEALGPDDIPWKRGDAWATVSLISWRASSTDFCKAGGHLSNGDAAV